jgi:hypothetical protein
MQATERCDADAEEFGGLPDAQNPLLLQKIGDCFTGRFRHVSPSSRRLKETLPKATVSANQQGKSFPEIAAI